MDDLRDAWASFVEVLKGYGDAAAYLNGPCSPEALSAAETTLGFPMPESLAELLKLNNGQRIEKDGQPIFKNPSRSNLDRRQSFLDAQSIAEAYRGFIEDELLVQEFGDREVPFASLRPSITQGEVFTVNRDSGGVSLIWTETYDFFNPLDWQVCRFDRGKDLAEFLRQQSMLY
ncbi:MAG TPA: SMI1/KNR4 family protein [Thermoanaerobaculia bacterium]|nr:SMI1/KNR4 family protein [Thermoanaerobaculia bacterium]